MDPSYFVTGPADDEDFARAEYLAEMLMSSLPSLRCRVIPVLPERWADHCSKLAAKLGCEARSPLVWAGTGKVLGGLSEFEAACDVKYGIHIPEVEPGTWAKIAKENHEALVRKLSGALPVLEPTGSGAARGAAVSEALLTGHERHVTGSTATASPLSGEGASAVVLALSPLPTPASSNLPASAKRLMSARTALTVVGVKNDGTTAKWRDWRSRSAVSGRSAADSSESSDAHMLHTNFSRPDTGRVQQPEAPK